MVEEKMPEGAENREGIEKLTFEEAMERLEQIVQKLERGDLSLEDSIGSFQQGIKLSRRCREILADAEYRVEYLLKEDGLLEEEESPSPGEGEDGNGGY